MEQLLYELGLAEAEDQHDTTVEEPLSQAMDATGTSGGGAKLGKVVCGPCEKPFTTKRALLRHMKENKRHRTEDEHSERQFKCRMCEVTCARVYDLRRHQLEKHPEGTLECQSCGSHYRPGSHFEEECASWSEARSSAVNIVTSATSAVGCLSNQASAITTFEMQLSRATQTAHSNLTPLESYYSTVPPATTLYVNQQQEAGLSTEDRKQYILPTCGHCHQKFEKMQKDVMQHLARHRSELDLQHQCLECDVSFVREQDLVHHRQNASTGECGFCFDHIQPCSGHHPASCLDREEFCVRVRSWEHTQLQLFGRSVTAYIQYRKASIGTSTTKSGIVRRQDDIKTVSVPSQVDYHTRMAEMAADFGSLQVHGRIYEYSDYNNGCTSASLPPPPPANPHIRTPSVGRRMQRPYLLAANPAPWHAPPYSPPQLASVYNASLPTDSRPLHGAGRRRSITSMSHRPVTAPQVNAFASSLIDASRDANGQTLLHRFARTNNYHAISLLLGAGIHPDDKDDDGRTALHAACDRGSYDTFVELLHSDASLNETDCYGYTPLHYAVLSRSCEMVRGLLLKGADANPKEQDGCTPLHLAFEEGSDDVVMELFSHGADVWATDRQGNTPSELARVTSSGGFVRQVALKRRLQPSKGR